MLRYGIHGFVWVGRWTTESGNYAITKSAELGFDLIELPLLRPAEFDVESHKQALKQAKIDAVCSLALPREFHLPHNPDGARTFLLSALDVVERLECDTLGGCIAYSLGVLTGEPPHPHERQLVIEVLRDIAGNAKRRGITLMLEACNRYETYLYNTLSDARDTILAVGADNLKLHADTYHMNIEEEGFLQAFRDCADVLGYIHMSESHRGLLGNGTVDWDDVFAGLVRANYSGILTMESFASINPDIRAATCLWRPPKQSAEVIAREGLKFMRGYAHSLEME